MAGEGRGAYPWYHIDGTESRHGMEAMVAGFSVYNTERTAVYELWGHGTDDAAARWDDAIRSMYESHGIKNVGQLANECGVPYTTIKDAHAFDAPHKMAWGLFMRICHGLGEDDNEIAGKAIGPELAAYKRLNAEYRHALSRTRELVMHFLNLSADNQQVILQMVANLPADDEQDGGSLALRGNMGTVFTAMRRQVRKI